MDVVALEAAHREALLRFFGGLPEGDLTFIEEEVTDPDVVRSWARGEGGGWRWVAVEEGDGEPAVSPSSARRQSSTSSARSGSWWDNRAPSAHRFH